MPTLAHVPVCRIAGRDSAVPLPWPDDIARHPPLSFMRGVFCTHRATQSQVPLRANCPARRTWANIILPCSTIPDVFLVGTPLLISANGFSPPSSFQTHLRSCRHRDHRARPRNHPAGGAVSLFVFFAYLFTRARQSAAAL